MGICALKLLMLGVGLSWMSFQPKRSSFECLAAGLFGTFAVTHSENLESYVLKPYSNLHFIISLNWFDVFLDILEKIRLTTTAFKKIYVLVWQIVMETKRLSFSWVRMQKIRALRLQEWCWKRKRRTRGCWQGMCRWVQEKEKRPLFAQPPSIFLFFCRHP